MTLPSSDADAEAEKNAPAARKRRVVGRPITPGTVLNPAGRPKGTRNRFSEQFYLDLAESWQAQGGDVLARVAQDDPSTYLRVCASLMPRVVETSAQDDFENMSDDELRRIIAAAASQLSVASG